MGSDGKSVAPRCFWAQEGAYWIVPEWVGLPDIVCHNDTSCHLADKI
jgi:hypothetical protein